VGADFFGIYGEKDSRKIVSGALSKYSNWDVKIIDTSGRNALNEDLLEEIRGIAEIAKPDEVMLILDASIGQQAGKQAEAFNKAAKITGVIITKLDGTAKGGGAISAVAKTGAPILFIGTGEHLDDLEYFNPARFLSRLLGMGDLETLMATAKELHEEIDEESVERMASGKFTLKDMYEIWDKMSKPGLFKKLFDSLPMFKLQQKEIDESLIDQSEAKIRKYKVIMDSMTYQELDEPDIVKGERIDRIARGSGTQPSDVKELLRDYKRMRDAMKNLRGNRKIISMLKKQLKEGNIEDFNQ
jgi:signal recognition particle subunit FFH/SRP54 (srp54)